MSSDEKNVSPMLYEEDAHSTNPQANLLTHTNNNNIRNKNSTKSILRAKSNSKEESVDELYTHQKTNRDCYLCDYEIYGPAIVFRGKKYCCVHCCLGIAPLTKGIKRKDNSLLGDAKKAKPTISRNALEKNRIKAPVIKIEKDDDEDYVPDLEF